MKRIIGLVSDYKLFVACILMALFGIAIDTSFLNKFNLNSLFLDMSIISMLALGQMLVILTGGIDLSVGNIASASSVFIASMMLFLDGRLPPELNILISVTYALAFGSLLGFINGFAVAVFRIPPMLATLCGMWIARGVSYYFLKGAATPFVVKSFTKLARVKVGFMPVAILIPLLTASLLFYILNNKRAGRAVYAIGGNEYSAYLSGTKVKKVKIAVYTLSGLLSSIGGIILGAFTGTSYVKGAYGYEMVAIAAVIIGGFSMTGGTGRVWNAFLGVVFLRMINKIMIFLNLSNQSEGIYIGIVLIIALHLSTSDLSFKFLKNRKNKDSETVNILESSYAEGERFEN